MPANDVHLDFNDSIFTKTFTDGDEPSEEAEENPSPAEVTELDGPDGLHLTSMGNGERFLRDHRSNVLWVEGSTINSAGTFHTWDGARWQPDNARAMLLAKETVSNLANLVAQAVAAGENSDRVKTLVNFWRSCENDHKVGEILSLARWNLVIKQGKFDSDLTCWACVMELSIYAQEPCGRQFARTTSPNKPMSHSTGARLARNGSGFCSRPQAAITN